MPDVKPRNATTKREEAQALADELLGDIELRRIGGADIARKADRLARLLDDADAMAWLKYEVSGYPTPIDANASAAAIRSGREANQGKV